MKILIEQALRKVVDVIKAKIGQITTAISESLTEQLLEALPNDGNRTLQFPEGCGKRGLTAQLRGDLLILRYEMSVEAVDNGCLPVIEACAEEAHNQALTIYPHIRSIGVIVDPWGHPQGGLRFDFPPLKATPTMGPPGST